MSMSMKKLRFAGTPKVTATSDGRLTVSVPIRLKAAGWAQDSRRDER